MSYETHSLQQGTDAWAAHRANTYNASDAGTALGINPYKSRAELIKELASGQTKEIDAHTQRRFDDGHRFERLARPLAEEMIGDDLAPATVSIAVPGLKRRLSASLDGIPFGGGETWEHKTLSASLAAAMDRGEIPDQYPPQMEQGMMITGATRCLFMASKWDENDQLIEEKHLWYESNPALRNDILSAWKMVESDVENYQHQEVIPAAVAAPIKDLPAVVLTVSGELAIKTNFDAWGKELRAFIKLIPEKPATDQEFADCKAAITAFKQAEAQLDSEESRVLSLVPDIDQMKRDKKLLLDLSSTTRLALEKLVARRETDVKIEIMQEGKDALAAHIAGLNKRLAKVQMPPIDADFAAAIKSKRNLEKMRDAVSALVAAKKIDSNDIADRIDANLKTIALETEYHFLFSDLAVLAMKRPDDLALIIRTRIADHKREEDRRAELAREKIRAEEEAKATAKAKAEQEEAERQRKANETPPAQAVPQNSVRAPEPAARTAPSVSSARLEETSVAAAHTGVTGTAKLRDEIDDLLIGFDAFELIAAIQALRSIKARRDTRAAA